jgi:hypothetical protein
MVDEQPYRVRDIGNDFESVLGEVRFESVPYDCVEFQEGLWLISTKSMPPRIYKRPSAVSSSFDQNSDIMHIGSIYNRKKNS